MKGKIAFVLGAAVGYVLGTRAGRERYEQIKQGAQTLWNAPPVQKGVAAARGAVEDRVEQLKESALSAGKEAFGAFMRGGSDARSDAATRSRSDSSGAAPSTATDSTSAESKSTDSKQTESKPAGSGKAGGGKAGSSGKAATASARRGGSGSSKGTAKSTSASKSKSTSTGSAKKAGDA